MVIHVHPIGSHRSIAIILYPAWLATILPPARTLPVPASMPDRVRRGRRQPETGFGSAPGRFSNKPTRYLFFFQMLLHPGDHRFEYLPFFGIRMQFMLESLPHFQCHFILGGQVCE